MKSLIKVLAVIGTGVLIGSVAGKYLKSERKQASKGIFKPANESKSLRSTPVNKPNELEMYFI